MKHEPPLDRTSLLDGIRGAYGIPARALTFVPEGFAAACYVLDAEDGDRTFVKVWPQLRVGDADAVRLHATLALTRAIHDRDLGVRVPYPLRTRDGALWASLAGVPFAIAPLLPGGPPPSPLTGALRREVGRTIAAIHRATPALADVLPPRETFAIDCEPALHRGLAAAERIEPSSRPGLLALRDWVGEHRADIGVQLARVHTLQSTVRRLDGPFVLCHTDFHSENALVDDGGRFFVLDWDGATVAPPEHDLQSGVGVDQAFGGAGFPLVLDAYREAGGAGPLHLDHFAFYLLRRYLEDMTARLDWLLKDDSAGHGDAELLYGMDAYGVARWSILDETLAEIARAL